MNAYQILGIMSQIDDEMDEQSANEKIKNKVEKIISSSIDQINQIINNNDLSTEEKLKIIGDNVSSCVKVIVSYIKIKDEDQRKEYNKKEKSNIDEELSIVDNMNKQGGKNAYQTIGVNAKEDYGLNNKIAENTYSYYTLALKDSDTKSLEELMEILLRMKKYSWAYAKIKTLEDREKYRLDLDEENRKDEYIQLAQYAKKKITDIGKASRSEKKNPWTFDFILYDDKSYKSISISNIGTIEYGSFIIPNENEVKEYRVVKQKKSGEKVESKVFTNIDYAKLQDNAEYRRLVVDSLLSDLNLNMGIKYLSGYIGILNSTGLIDFNVDDISICQKWQEHLNRTGENSKTSLNDELQKKDNQIEKNQISKNDNEGR